MRDWHFVRRVLLDVEGFFDGAGPMEAHDGVPDWELWPRRVRDGFGDQRQTFEALVGDSGLLIRDGHMVRGLSWRGEELLDALRGEENLDRMLSTFETLGVFPTEGAILYAYRAKVALLARDQA